MEFPSKLIKATLIKRYKRFLADATLEDGSVITAHCPNTGSMKSCGGEGDIIYLSSNNDPKRKLKYTWQLTATHSGFININTHSANTLVKEALGQGAIPPFADYKKIKPEKKRGDSRLDFYLSPEENLNLKPCWIEVKSVTLFQNDMILFPDAVSTRALKHVEELEKIATEGERAVLFFLVNRPEGKAFQPAATIHPEYAEALKRAQKNGVEILAYRAIHSLEKSYIGEAVPIKLS